VANVELLGDVLRVVADLDVVSEPETAFGRSDLPGKDAQQRRLAGAVRPDDGDLFPAPYDPLGALEDFDVSVAVSETRELHAIDPGALARREPEPERPLASEKRDVFELGELLDAALHGRSLVRLRTKARDKALGLLA